MKGFSVATLIAILSTFPTGLEAYAAEPSDTTSVDTQQTHDSEFQGHYDNEPNTETQNHLPTGNLGKDLAMLGDKTHDVSIAEFAIPAGVFTASALFVKTPALVQAREYVQKHLSQHGKHKTSVDNYLQYLPMVEAYGLYFCGMKGEHGLLDRTILLAMSYATYAILTNTFKYTFKEQRPDSWARNSFPSGHTGTVVAGAEFLRREYWNSNKWVAMTGYVAAAAVAYFRIYNDRHWINDVVGGAALGYLSTTFSYWLYPKIFKKRAKAHRSQLLENQPIEGGRDAYLRLLDGGTGNRKRHLRPYMQLYFLTNSRNTYRWPSRTK